MSAIQDFTNQYIIPRYLQDKATAAHAAEVGNRNGKSQPHEPDLQPVTMSAAPGAGPVAAGDNGSSEKPDGLMAGPSPTAPVQAGDAPDGGPPTSPADAIKLLIEWTKRGQIDGDVESLKSRLRSKDPQVVQGALDEVDDAREAIANGEPFHVEKGSPQDSPNTKAMSTSDKINLRRIRTVRELVPDRARQAALGRWIEANHETVAEIATRMGVQGWTGVADGHGHLTSRPDFAEAVIQEWQAQEGITNQELEIQQRRQSQNTPWRPGGGTGGGTPPPSTPPDEHGGGGATGGGHPGGGTPPAESDAKTPTSTADTEKIIQELATEAAKVHKGATELHQGAKSGADAKTGLQQANMKEGEVDALARRLIEKVPALRGVQGATTKEMLGNALIRLKQVPTVGGVGNVVMMLQNAYGLAESAKYVFQAHSVTEGLRRAMTVGVEVAKGQAEFEVVMLITRGNPVGAAIYYGVKTAIAEHDETPKQERQRRKKIAIGHMLEQMYPGTEWLTGERGETVGARTPPGHSQDEWPAAIQAVDQARKEFLIKQARETGRNDGFTGKTTGKDKFEPDEDDEEIGITQKDLLAAYEAGLKEGRADKAALPNNSMLNPDIEAEKKRKAAVPQEERTHLDPHRDGFKHGVLGKGTERAMVDANGVNDSSLAYSKGFIEGAQRAERARYRAREQGLRDGEFLESHVDEIPTWEDVAEIRKQGDASWGAEITSLYKAAFSQGFEKVFKKLNDEAYDMGKYYGKGNVPDRAKEIQQRSEVARMRKFAPDREQQLLESYNRGFAEGRKGTKGKS
jgi:hypothetical protein